MTQRTTSTLCLLLAVAGLSFGIGQTVGQDRAQADAQTAKVLKVKDAAAKTYLQYIFRMQLVLSGHLKDIKAQAHAICLNVRETVPNDPFSGSPPICPSN